MEQYHCPSLIKEQRPYLPDALENTRDYSRPTAFVAEFCFVLSLSYQQAEKARQ
ncbi:hypothetical protein [Candidatus Williamhamiltonella defendens]|uniref:hypothetical protein n=1 Tax=Candidatus Williamhamiltonella defendens TaxID=138072 RepID=UPI001F3159DF|nr:hypothetical protein [Candidatus Hamiltonella defensa]